MGLGRVINAAQMLFNTSWNLLSRFVRTGKHTEKNRTYASDESEDAPPPHDNSM